MGYRSKSKNDQGTIAVNILVLGKAKLSNCRQDLMVSIIATMILLKVKLIIAVNFQFKQLESRSLKKNQGFNGIRTRDLRDTGAMLYQLSYEATHWERGQFIEFISSRAVK